jgi:hypothetical protein
MEPVHTLVGPGDARFAARAAGCVRELLQDEVVVDKTGTTCPLQSTDRAVITPHVEQSLHTQRGTRRALPMPKRYQSPSA